MINVRFVIAHGLWILGCAIILAAFSYYDWLAREQGRRRRDVMRSARGWSASVTCGLLLVGSAFVRMESLHPWQRALWMSLCLGAAWTVSRRRGQGPSGQH